MPFTPAQQSAIKSYINTDPDALGFAAELAKDPPNYAGCTAILNWVRDGTTACPVNGIVGAAVTIFRNDVAPREVVNAIANADFVAMTAVPLQKLNLVFLATPLDMTLPNMRQNMQSIFSSASAATTQALTNVVKRNGSALEKLLGITGVSISMDEVVYIMTVTP